MKCNLTVLQDHKKQFYFNLAAQKTYNNLLLILSILRQ